MPHSTSSDVRSCSKPSSKKCKVGPRVSPPSLVFPMTFKDYVSKLLAVSWFLKRSYLLEHITHATKIPSGEVSWITLDRSFHSQCVRTVFGLIPAESRVGVTNDAVKMAMFDFLLGVLNGKSITDFFDHKKAEAGELRAAKTTKRLARKRSRAAKRERTREESKVVGAAAVLTKDGKGTKVAGSKARACSSCLKTFTSRKTISKHSCARKERKARGNGSTVATVVNVPAPVIPQVATSLVATEPILPTTAPVTVRSVRADVGAPFSVSALAAVLSELDPSPTTVAPCVGRPSAVLECEDCSSPATGVKDGRWPKCDAHSKWIDVERWTPYVT
ncbi:hypothetical protein F4604DRAFT_619407 [Suillus subluteus]|nr:hypothetical protein F4604DRAFT_619407 [Suillus subluteus]